MKEKANYPENNKNTKIDHFLAFRRKAKKKTIKLIFKAILQMHFWRPLRWDSQFRRRQFEKRKLGGQLDGEYQP